MKNEGFDNNLIIIILCAILPIILVIISIVINETRDNKEDSILRTTYIHAFYVNGTDSDKKLKEDLKNINEKFELITYDITEESLLYKKVLDYFEIEEKVYNPLIVINDKYFLTDYEVQMIEKTIEEENKTYSKKDLTNDELLRYDIVDRLSSGEEVPKNEQ